MRTIVNNIFYFNIVRGTMNYKTIIYASLFITTACNQLSANETTTYSTAGVSIDAGNTLVDVIKPLAKSTARRGTDAQLGGFGSLFDLAQLDYKDPILVSTTDGVGTKLKLAKELHKHDTVGIDLVAMCVNDLIVQGAEPIVFLDYFATGKLDVAQAAEVIAGIARACKETGCALSGGETAEMPGMYAHQEYDLAGFAVGIVERSRLLPCIDDIKEGDVVIGLASSGIHSNGYSLVRYLITKYNIDLNQQPPFASPCTTLGELLLTPTTLYVQPLLPLLRQGSIKALAHITGGGLWENIPRVLPKNYAVELDMATWPVPAVFSWISQLGNIPDYDMIRTFNVGIGMIAIVAAENAPKVLQHLETVGQKAYCVGSVIALPKDSKQVIINNIHF
jgi:phosphoribosylaminoimidazole synthetase